MARMHVLLHATVDDDGEAVTEHASWEGAPEFLAANLAEWLEENARQVRQGLEDDEADEARGDGS